MIVVLSAAAKLKIKPSAHLTPQNVGVLQSFSEWRAKKKINQLCVIYIRPEAVMTDVRDNH